MRRIIPPGWLALLFLLLAACATQDEPALNQPGAALDLNRPYANSDLSLVNSTGRPQFLNSHAVW